MLSLVRIVDRVILTAVGPDAPEQMQEVVYPLSMVVSLMPGEARGRGNLSIESRLIA